MSITLQISRAKSGNPREGGREEREKGVEEGRDGILQRGGRVRGWEREGSE